MNDERRVLRVLGVLREANWKVRQLTVERRVLRFALSVVAMRQFGVLGGAVFAGVFVGAAEDVSGYAASRWMKRRGLNDREETE